MADVLTGQWKCVEHSGNEGEAFVIEGPGRTVCWSAASYDIEADADHITEEDRSIAALICAAPDMLEALKVVRQCFEAFRKVEEWRVMADCSVALAVRAVIRKAETPVSL